VLERLDRLEGKLSELTAMLRRGHMTKMLVGWDAIGRFCHKSPRQLARYRHSAGFPALGWGKRVYSSPGLIEDWIISQDRSRHAKSGKGHTEDDMNAGKETQSMPVMREPEHRQVNPKERDGGRIP